MRLHRLLGWIHLVLSGLALLAGIAFCLALAIDDDPRATTALGYVGPPLLMFAVPLLLPSFIGGIGLVQGRRWAQILIGVLSGLLLLAFPIGTALGAFGLWVLVIRPSPSPTAVAETAAAETAARISQETQRILGLLIAAGVVGLGFIVVIGAGFRLHGQPSPLGASFWPALAALVAIIAFVAVKRPFAADPRPGALNPVAQARDRARMRGETAAFQEERRLRLERLFADPTTAPYAALIRSGEYWSDEQIAYDQDVTRRETCSHLAPIEGAMRGVGLKVRLGWAAQHVEAQCHIDEAALTTMFSPGSSVGYEEIYLSERAREDLPVAQVRCSEHASTIRVLHPEEGGVETPWFPAKGQA